MRGLEAVSSFGGDGGLVRNVGTDEKEKNVELGSENMSLTSRAE